MVTVEPESFRFVLFDAEAIRRIAEDVMSRLGVVEPVSIVVDETTPLSRITADLSDSIVIEADSGAFEDTRMPRHLSDATTALALGRVLLRARDRLRGGFAEAPADADLTLAQASAWNTYAVGRLARLGVHVHEPRWRYDFRNRHGFTDRADAAFEQLWNGDGITWSELDGISRSSAAVPASS